GLNILVNNGGVQFQQDDFLDVTPEQIKATFETNIYGMMYLTQAALPHLSEGDKIINSTSVTAYRGSAHLIDYSSTKGAIVSFTRSLATSLMEKGIYVNAVAPGPIYTPLIPATFDADKVENQGSDTPMARRGQPAELAPSYVFLASTDSSYMTGQTLHLNGGDFLTS
ncbi:SDR family oxidoreductase, partial [Staphylococcus agnetis]|uniref:SDR family oxidoreductase n=1 Tax=Staphylococcus agnetis TaxID=985762 RepID=UPI00142FE818